MWLEQLSLIKQKFIDDFSARLNSGCQSQSENVSSLIPLTVTPQENVDLIKSVIENEIHIALFEMDPHKAPGLDGFGASFFQDHWPSIKDQYVLMSKSSLILVNSSKR